MQRLTAFTAGRSKANFIGSNRIKTQVGSTPLRLPVWHEDTRVPCVIRVSDFNNGITFKIVEIMSVKYVARAIGNPGVTEAGIPKYYASIARESKVDLRTLMDEISELNVTHAGSILAVLETFLSKVHYHLVNGRGVELGQLGTFYPSIKSQSSDSAEAVSRQNIKRLKVLFRPSKLLRDKLAVVKFEKLANDSPAEEPEV